MKSGHVTWSLSFFFPCIPSLGSGCSVLDVKLQMRAYSCDMAIISRLFNPKEKKNLHEPAKFNFTGPDPEARISMCARVQLPNPRQAELSGGKSNLHSRYLLLNLLRPYVGRRMWALGFCWDHCCGLHQRSGLWLTLWLLPGWLQVFFCSRRVYTSKIIKGYS